MHEDAPHRTQIDYVVHPVDGPVLIVWGVAQIGVTLVIGRGEEVMPLALGLMMGLGIALLGGAVMLPAGRTRRNLIRGVLTCIGLYFAVLVSGFFCKP